MTVVLFVILTSSIYSKIFFLDSASSLKQANSNRSPFNAMAREHSSSMDTAASVEFDALQADDKGCTLHAVISNQHIRVEPYGPSGKHYLEENLCV